MNHHSVSVKPIDPQKFRDPRITAKGEARAHVALGALETLWINTGTLCNITCANCYIESSPRNDALSYISAAEVAAFLNEAETSRLPLQEVGFTGGEPFMNPDFLVMLEDALKRGFKALVLTNAMKPMMNHSKGLLALHQQYGARLTLRVSLDHPDPPIHDAERGAGSFDRTLEGLRFLASHGFRLHIAGRAAFGAGQEAALRAEFAAVFAAHGIAVFNRAQHRQRASFMGCFQFISAGTKAARHTTGARADVPQHGLCPISGGLVPRRIARALRRIGNEDNSLQATALHFREINAAISLSGGVRRVGPSDIDMGVKRQRRRVDGLTHAASPQAFRKPSNKSPMISTL